MAKYSGLIAGGLLTALSFVPGFQGLFVPGLLMLGMGAISALTTPDAPSVRNARAAELNMATAASGVPVPVFFGEQRITGNFLRYDKGQLRTVEIRENTPGGKGGGGGGQSQVVGYEYYLSYEYGLCMGEVDGVAQVISTPGEIKLLDDHPEVAAIAAATTTNAGFTRPAVNSNVDVTVLTGVASRLTALDRVEIPNYGRFEVVSILSTTSVRLKLLEKLGTQRGGYGSSTVPTAQPVLHINPTATAAVRKLTMDSTAELVAGETITVNGFGEWTVDSIASPVATCTLTRILGTGAIAVGTSVTAERDPALMFSTDSSTADKETMDVVLVGAKEGGTVRLYRGTEWQVRTVASAPYAADGMNYRPLCFGDYLDYKMGNHPQAQSHHWILRRLPKCIRDDGTVFTALKTRGSDTSTHINYWQANGAALLYEILTNKTWGRGMSSARFNEASWQSVSEFFAANNIGLGITLERADKLSNILAAIRETLRIVLLWDGDTLKIRTLLDTATQHGNIITLTKSQVRNVKFKRPTWENTFNEVNSEYANRARNYKGDSVRVQDLANVQTVGRVNPKNIALAGVADVTLAQRLAALVLKEASYPLAGLTFDMDRTASHLEHGDVVRFIWDEWSDGTVTSYWIVGTTKPGGSESETIPVTLTEDPDLSAVESEELTVTPGSTLNWNNVTGSTDEQLRLNPPVQANTLPVYPLAVLEVPAILTAGKESRVAFLGQKPIPSLTGIAAYASQYGGDYKFLGTAATFAVTGTLLADYAAGPRTDRGGFTFSLNDYTNDKAKVLQAQSVVDDADDMDVLANSPKDFIVIGDEIMMVGSIVEQSTNVFLATNLIRALFGTRVAAVPAGATFFYSRTMPDGVLVDSLEQDEETAFRGYPVDSKGVANVGSDIFIAHASPNDRLLLGVGVRPLTPEPYSMTGGTPRTLRVRPQFFDRGAAVWSLNKSTAAVPPITNIGAMRFMVEALDGAGAVLQGKTLKAHTYTPDDIEDVSLGMVEIEYTLPGSTATVRVYSELDGQISVESAAFTV